MKEKITFLTIFIVCIMTTIVWAAEPFIYPREGQSNSQKIIDKTDCSSWAEQETGADARVIQAKLEMMEEMEFERTTSYEEDEFGLSGMFTTVFKDAARGAALGAIDDAIDKEVGTYAAQEGLKSILDVRSDKRDYQAAQEENVRIRRKRELVKQYEAYQRAFAVCMDAKGYSVR